jgi:hypothetical protein
MQGVLVYEHFYTSLCSPSWIGVGLANKGSGKSADDVHEFGFDDEGL